MSAVVYVFCVLGQLRAATIQLYDRNDHFRREKRRGGEGERGRGGEFLLSLMTKD
jgi:hypothetical protein